MVSILISTNKQENKVCIKNKFIIVSRSVNIQAILPRGSLDLLFLSFVQILVANGKYIKISSSFWNQYFQNRKNGRFLIK